MPAQRPSMIRRWLASTLAVTAMAAALCVAPGAPRGARAAGVTIFAAGDIACDPDSGSFNDGAGTSGACRMRSTSNLILSAQDYAAVLPLGDNQYEHGTLGQYRDSYAPTWGRLDRSRIFPVPGNHEYQDPAGDAAGYFDFFGARAHGPKGYYSYDLGSWHVVALNSNCAWVSCGGNSPQAAWLARDLADSRGRCQLAYSHAPRFASGGDTSVLDDLWNIAKGHGVDVWLAGHMHQYERLAPLNRRGEVDSHGIRTFIVGTGGKSLQDFDSARSGSRMRVEQFGVLRLRLRATDYSWAFIGDSGRILDSGSGRCH
jgi:acid phosphatase type 7